MCLERVAGGEEVTLLLLLVCACAGALLSRQAQGGDKGLSCTRRCIFFFSLGFKSFREWVLCSIYSCEISFPSGHNSRVIPIELSLETGGYLLYFIILVMVFPRHVLGTDTGQSGQGQALRDSVTGRGVSLDTRTELVLSYLL